MTTAPLTGAVRARVVGLAADALGRMEVQQLPASLRRVASFAPARRARLAGTQMAGVLAEDDGFRERVAVQVRAGVPDLVLALEDDGGPVADPVDLAAVAYLLRPEGWAGILEAANGASSEPAAEDGLGPPRPPR